MKTAFGFTFAAFLLCTVAASTARAQNFAYSDGGMYWSVRGGLSQVRATSYLFFPALLDDPATVGVDESFPTQEEWRNIELDLGFVLGGSIGYAFVYPGYSGGFRIEAEAIYRRNDDGETNAEFASTDSGDGRSWGHQSSPIDGSVEVESAMINVLLDLPTGSRFTPYVGAGGGASRLRINALLYDVPRFFYFLGFPVVIDETHYALSYQYIAGVSYHLSRSMAITAEWRQFRLAAERFTRLHGLQELEALRFEDWSLGVRFTF